MPHASPPNLAQIFQFPKWQKSLQGHVPRINDGSPLSLFYHADALLLRTVKKLNRISNQSSMKFKRTADQVHRSQKLMLDTIYIVYRSMPAEIKASRDYRINLPPDDRRELENGFSENILFAAEALIRGFRIRGIEPFTELLKEAACQLFAALEALRVVFRTQAMIKPSERQPVSISLSSVVRDFDKAWADFEHSISYCYVAMQQSSRYPVTRPIRGRLRFPEKPVKPSYDQELMVVLLSETILRGIQLKLFPLEDLHSCEPYLIFAIPRLALVKGLLYSPDYLPLGGNQTQTVHKWFTDDVDQLKSIKKDLQRLSSDQLLLLERQLVLPDETAHHLPIRREICSLMDSKQSGIHAKELTALLGRVFKLYAPIDEPVQKPPQVDSRKSFSFTRWRRM